MVLQLCHPHHRPFLRPIRVPPRLYLPRHQRSYPLQAHHHLVHHKVSPDHWICPTCDHTMYSQPQQVQRQNLILTYQRLRSHWVPIALPVYLQLRSKRTFHPTHQVSRAIGPVGRTNLRATSRTLRGSVDRLSRFLEAHRVLPHDQERDLRSMMSGW